MLPRYERIVFEKSLIAPQGQAAGGLRLPRPSAARCDARPRHRTPPRSAAARDGAGRRARRRHRAADAVLSRARDPGRERRPGRGPPGRLQADALRRDGCGRHRPAPPLCALSRLSAAARRRTRYRDDRWAPGVRLDQSATWSRRRCPTRSRRSCRSISKRFGRASSN